MPTMESQQRAISRATDDIILLFPGLVLTAVWAAEIVLISSHSYIGWLWFALGCGAAVGRYGEQRGAWDNAFQVMLGPILQGVTLDPSMFRPSCGRKRDQSIGGKKPRAVTACQLSLSPAITASSFVGSSSH